MKYEIYDCSPEAKNKIKSFEDKLGLEARGKVWADYPFRTMSIGQCFLVPFSKENGQSLRSLASQHKKATGKIFTVIKHNDLKIFEVARVA